MTTKILVIVESPAKCSKIQSYLGPGFIVKASFGHIRNLDKKKGLHAIEISNNYKPNYAIITEKKKYIKELQKYSKQCSEIIIASDLDREGEAIGYHLVKVLKLDMDKTKRIVFNEITKKAINDAVNNPRLLDKNLIYAQQARQILDYVIGFDISPVLWKHVKNHLSAGRCQSPALNLICDREKEINDFKTNTYFDLEGNFTNKNKVLFKSKSKTVLDTKETVLEHFELFKNAIFKIRCINESISSSKPSAPYITSTIQQDSSSKLGINPKSTMKCLQKLYEAGKITYMRTDSKVLSDQCTNDIKNLVIEKYGDKYHQLRKYKNKSKNAQEAHECIRPVDVTVMNLDDNFTSSEHKLYEIIWKRTIASQMSEMKTQVFKIKIENNKNKVTFVSCFEKTLFLGYGEVYGYDKINEVDNNINKIEEGEIVDVDKIISNEKLTRASPRFTEASLIKELEKKGIGRPSTFSSILETLFKREYIKKESRKGNDKDVSIITLSNNNISENTKTIKTDKETNKIFTTNLGNTVNDFMLQHFNNLLNHKFTSTMENNLDEIAKGNLNWVTLVDSIYKSFHPKVTELSNKPGQVKWDNINTKPVLGINPENNKNVYCYKGKYGPVIQEGDNNNCRYVGLKKETDVSSVTLEECLIYLKFPKNLGVLDTQDVILNTGSNGFYVRHGSNTYSVSNSDISLDEVSDIIKNKKKSIIKEFSGGISIRNGQYGPFILKSGKNSRIVSVPYDKKNNAEDLTLKECQELLKKKKYSTKKTKFKK